MTLIRLDPAPRQQPAALAPPSTLINAHLGTGRDANAGDAQEHEQATHLLHFEPLGGAGAGLDIPCDPRGHVGLDALDDDLRNEYLFARALVGRAFAPPTVRPAAAFVDA